MERLNWSTYKKLQAAMDQIDHDYQFSALSLLGLSYYGISIRFQIVEYDNFKIIFFDSKFNRFILSDADVFNARVNQILHYGDHFILMPIFDKNQISTFDAVYCAFYKLKQLYAIKSDWAVEAVNTKQLQTLSQSIDFEIVYDWNAHYLYKLEKFKTFSGKKLQKKRNHLNYFLKNHFDQVEATPLCADDFDEVLDFIWETIHDGKEDPQLNEYIFSRNFLAHYDPMTMSGLVVRQKKDRKILGFTIGYSHKKSYEVFFEKAVHSWRGLFPFIISQNLLLNNINQAWMDRQDDMNEENLAKSKRSYYPEKVLKSHMIYITDSMKDEW
ncbi:hypothetical protein J2Z62_000587 [Mycoplasmoides fastidiosum]|uniref:Phosphatidylglycerol lysyltransferase C-terminal domain-containing protein n=1 Tax=Mycoplasmoides fastidiosum TaxID=92758 RepID=A0ABU0LZM0_9BACT|nr:phosphatidylglycerol lysyltransferase domain-containing protein [Mycoplasmoides fastidiosum]MDQ0514149.1 hypothetical protein [Mycoplasmoides fastidiosum]UUD37443.1 phosphatidylglycerol lysyltransferase domain-containing protein [Mycoplasmoides fastidiosum]